MSLDYQTLHPANPTVKTLSQQEWNSLLASISSMSIESRAKHSTGPVAIADVTDRRVYYVLSGSAGAVKFNASEPHNGVHYWSISKETPMPATKSAQVNPARAAQTPIVETRGNPPKNLPSKLLAAANAAAHSTSNTASEQPTGGLLARTNVRRPSKLLAAASSAARCAVDEVDPDEAEPSTLLARANAAAKKAGGSY